MDKSLGTFGRNDGNWTKQMLPCLEWLTDNTNGLCKIMHGAL